ncbi:hypothetical protein B0H13DRAFT_1924130 [Mycena leptocephala]|nr:hypothetical protein B0H13DRAFT_1924130 [Mycena leptocephala]
MQPALALSLLVVFVVLLSFSVGLAVPDQWSYEASVNACTWRADAACCTDTDVEIQSERTWAHAKRPRIIQLHESDSDAPPLAAAFEKTEKKNGDRPFEHPSSVAPTSSPPAHRPPPNHSPSPSPYPHPPLTRLPDPDLRNRTTPSEERECEHEYPPHPVDARHGRGGRGQACGYIWAPRSFVLPWLVVRDLALLRQNLLNQEGRDGLSQSRESSEPERYRSRSTCKTNISRLWEGEDGGRTKGARSILDHTMRSRRGDARGKNIVGASALQVAMTARPNTQIDLACHVNEGREERMVKRR